MSAFMILMVVAGLLITCAILSFISYRRGINNGFKEGFGEGWTKGVSAGQRETDSWWTEVESAYESGPSRRT